MSAQDPKTAKTVVPPEPLGIGVSQEEFLLWRLMGQIPFETFRKRLSALEIVARFYGVDPEAEGWLTRTMFKLALEHPHMLGPPRRNGRPRSIEKFADDRRFLTFVFKLRGMLSAKQGKQVSLRHVALKIAALEIAADSERPVLEVLDAGEAEDRVAYYAKRITELRKLHADIEARYLKPGTIPGTDTEELV